MAPLTACTCSSLSCFSKLGGSLIAQRDQQIADFLCAGKGPGAARSRHYD